MYDAIIKYMCILCMLVIANQLLNKMFYTKLSNADTTIHTVVVVVVYICSAL